MSISEITSITPGFLQPTWASGLDTADSGTSGFAQLLMRGIDQVNHQLNAADAASTAFAINDSIPPHQVTFALEKARLSLQLMLQVRARLVEGYQEAMRMQL